jgi:hypothetical protein
MTRMYMVITETFTYTIVLIDFQIRSLCPPIGSSTRIYFYDYLQSIKSLIGSVACNILCRHYQMSTTSDLSSGPPLCYCGVPARVRNSWTETNPTRKWYGCINYKVNLEISFVLYVVVSSLTYLPSFLLFFFPAESR